MAIKKTISVIVLCILTFSLYAQTTRFVDDADRIYLQALELFRKEKFGAAQKKFEQAIAHYGTSYHDLKTNAEFYRALCAIELFNDDAAYLISRFIAEYPESPKAERAYFEMAKFRYRQEAYDNAIHWFEKTNEEHLGAADRAEYYFKLGYAYFRQGNMDMANYHFYKIKDRDTRYTAPAIYFYGHIAYENENYQTALQEFMRLSEDPTFSVVVPYYITQIYYYQKKYGEVIRYGKELLGQESVRRKPEISKLVGESYFHQNTYEKALPYLQAFNASEATKGREDKYQLAFTFYQLDSLDKAIELFELVTGADDRWSQNAYYHLADCYLKTGDKNKARLAFSAASKMDHDETIQEDALFNYAKISLELKYTPFNDAIVTFNKYLEKYKDSYKREEVFNHLVTAYMNTKNYEAALASMDQIADKSVSIKKAYQRVAYFRALELFNNLEFEASIEVFRKSLQYHWFNREINAKSRYWMAEAYYRLGEYEKAITGYNEFLLSTGAFMTKEYYPAHYSMGYSYFKRSDYANALTWFRKYVNLEEVKSGHKPGDAYNRIGDCYFMQRKYWQAIENYDEAIQRNAPDMDYAYFQKGFAFGLVERPNKKIDALNHLITHYEASAYYDDALYELGRSYIQIERMDQAREHFQRIAVEYPLSSYMREALLQLGLIHYNQDQHEQALGYFKRLVSDFPGTSEAKSALTGIKNIYVDLNQVDQYVAFVNTLDEGISISVSEQDSLIYIAAEKKYMSGTCQESMPDFTNYLERFPRGRFITNARFYKGECHASMGDTSRAIESLQYVTEQSKNEFTEDALLLLARLYYESNEMLRAYDHYLRLEKVAESASYLNDSRIGMMRTAYALGNYKDVLFACNKVLMNNKLPEEIERETHFKKGRAYYELDKFDEALDELRLVAGSVTSREGAQAKYLVASIYYSREDYELAEQEIKHFIAMNSPHAYWLGKCFILLSEIYKKQDELFKAKATLQSLIDHYTITDDGIIDEANKNLLSIIKEEKEQAFKEGEEEIDLNLSDENDNSGSSPDTVPTNPDSINQF